MSVFEEFLKCLGWRPIQALEALYWWLTGRRVRARARLRRDVSQAPYAYQVWQKTVEFAQASAAKLSRHAGWVKEPRIVVVVLEASSTTQSEIAASLRSVLRQSYENFELVAPSSSARPDFPREASQRVTIHDGLGLMPADFTVRGDYVLFLKAGDQLSVDALLVFAESIQKNPSAEVFYSDRDELDGQVGRRNPWFKPRWDSEMFLAQDYLSDACIIGWDLASQFSQSTTLYELLLAATTKTREPVIHVPFVACHVLREGHKEDTSSRLQTVADHVASRGGKPYIGPFSSIRVKWPLPSPSPLVSIIIPTRDKVTLLEACVSSVLRLTDYTAYEIIIVDNQSSEESTARFFSDINNINRPGAPEIRVLRYDDDYNYSAINNFAAREAKGEFLCLLNNDTEIFELGWLSEMMRYAVRDEVGAVGAMLLYPDNTIQHAGVVLGMGQAAGHAHRFLPRSEPGYFAQAHIPRFVSAVTAACLVVKKAKFDAVGGLDEVAFNVAYNDVDLCLKLEQAGWRNAYVPQATLIHYESKSRGSDMSPMHIERYMRELSLLQERWGTRDIVDPAFHPYLDRSTETYSLRL
jgi:GT2 family glycosyltransferase